VLGVSLFQVIPRRAVFDFDDGRDSIGVKILSGPRRLRELLRFEQSRSPAAHAERRLTGPYHAGTVPANHRLKLAARGRSVAESLRRTRAAA
jgi:hypothetical protein